MRPGDHVQYIDVFDGKPDEEAYLAPDNDRAGASTFTLRAIYQHGRIVTIRCKYKSGFATDVELKTKIERCVASEKKSGGLSVICR